MKQKLIPDSTDSRRDLFDFAYPVQKLIVAKDNCVLGLHYHKIKTEVFVLICGAALAELDSIDGVTGNTIQLQPLDRIDVPPNTLHAFTLRPGSIMLGFCSHPHDPSDDYRL